MGIAYNYGAVESNSLTFNSIVTAIEHNNSAIESIRKQLDASFTGDAADTGWKPKVQLMISKLHEYQVALNTLKNVVREVAGEQGYMQTTDKDQGSRFLAVNI